MHPNSNTKPVNQAEAPSFVMWQPLEPDIDRDWDRQWFGHELIPEAALQIRGVGIREPMFNADVTRPLGTGDWLIMLFHEAARLNPASPDPSTVPLSMVIWEPQASQFYSWGQQAGTERHSWMHVEGTFVRHLIDTLDLPKNTPVELPDSDVMETSLNALLVEMRMRYPDMVILQNLFENWARAIRRQIRPGESAKQIPEALLKVRRFLDADYRQIPPLDELAELASISRSHLCHRFQEYFGSSISGYVIRKRMSAAQRLLFEVELRISDIAVAVGYPDIYQFSKQFKKTFGISPSEYRKNQVIADTGPK